MVRYESRDAETVLVSIVIKLVIGSMKIDISDRHESAIGNMKNYWKVCNIGSLESTWSHILWCSVHTAKCG